MDVEASNQGGEDLKHYTPRTELAADNLFTLFLEAAGSTAPEATKRGLISVSAAKAAGMQTTVAAAVWQHVEAAQGMDRADFVAEYGQYVYPDALAAAIKACSPTPSPQQMPDMCEGSKYCVSPRDLTLFGLDPKVVAEAAPSFRRFGKPSCDTMLYNCFCRSAAH